MRLEVLLPFRTFADETGISRIVAETRDGSFGLLPHRRDCVAALVPGILSYESETEGEVFVAVDEGVLVKTGGDVRVAVRRALRGTDLAMLRDAVQRDYLTRNALEQGAREATRKLESGFVGRFARFHGE
jgi:F-type H+-transporting ATPase subunit epsilon